MANQLNLDHAALIQLSNGTTRNIPLDSLTPDCRIQDAEEELTYTVLMIIHRMVTIKLPDDTLRHYNIDWFSNPEEIKNGQNARFKSIVGKESVIADCHPDGYEKALTTAFQVDKIWHMNGSGARGPAPFMARLAPP